MKIKIFFMAFMVAVASLATAQEKKGDKGQKMTAEQRIDFRVAKMQKWLKLDGAAAEEFAPLYKEYLQEMAILLCLALALTPAFKMKFWNCGAEGQALMGGLASIFCMIQFGGKLPNTTLIIVVAVTSILAGAIWGLIPAIFKALFNTNETLFTLMMNYIATQIVAYYVYIEGGGSNVINPVPYGNFPTVGNNEYFVNIAIVTVITVLMYVYLKFSKQGYEIAVVGESQNTARYIGINVKKVIIRTMAISGALCGVTGMLLVAGKDHSINTNLVGGQGFTAILMSWLGQFNPFIMVVMTGIVVFLRIGVAKVADTRKVNRAFDSMSATPIRYSDVLFWVWRAWLYIQKPTQRPLPTSE